MIRALLDICEAHHVRLIVGDRATLLKPQHQAVREAEVDWAAPRTPLQAGGGGWGSQRAIMFSGLSIAQQVRRPAPPRRQPLSAVPLARLRRPVGSSVLRDPSTS